MIVSRMKETGESNKANMMEIDSDVMSDNSNETMTKEHDSDATDQVKESTEESKEVQVIQVVQLKGDFVQYKKIITKGRGKEVI